MQTMSYSRARNNLSKLMEKVNEEHDPIIITRQNGKEAVIMSLEDYNSMEETFYLLRSPKNAERLNRAINDFAQNKNFKKVNI